MVEGKRSKEFNEGYKAATDDLLDKEKLELFKEGYKAGFRDGYMAFLMDMKDKMPAEFKEQMDDGAQPWIWPW